MNLPIALGSSMAWGGKVVINCMNFPYMRKWMILMPQAPSSLHLWMPLFPLHLLYKSAFFFTFLCVIDGMVLSLVLSLSCWASCHNLWFLADGCSECFPEWNFHSGGSKAATFHRQPASWCNKYFYPYTCSVFLYYYCFYYCGVWVCVPKCMNLTFPDPHT